MNTLRFSRCATAAMLVALVTGCGGAGPTGSSLRRRQVLRVTGQQVRTAICYTLRAARTEFSYSATPRER